MTYMLVEELVGKRLQLLQNFREGLDYFGLVGMIKANPSLWKPLFVTENPEPMSADTFMSLVEFQVSRNCRPEHMHFLWTLSRDIQNVKVHLTAGFFLVFRATGQTNF